MMASGYLRHRISRAVLTVLMLVSSCGSTPCSYHNSTDFRLNECLASIRREAENKNKFWFGEKYMTICKNQSEFGAECFNPLASSQDSLVSRLFRLKVYDGDKLKSFIMVSYKTHTGGYKACGNTYFVSESRTVVIDPLVDDQSLSPFQLLSRPDISWTNSSFANSSFHALAIIDAGYVTVNALYINIPGQNIGESHTIIKYQPPLNPSPNRNPYVFLLFTQTSFIELPPQWLQKLSLRNIGQLEEFLIKFNLEGPTGMTWFSVRADPYSADRSQSPGNMNTCAQFVNEAFRKKQLPFLPIDRPDLNIYLDIRFESLPIKFSCCCQDYSYPATVFNPNPIGDGEVKAVLMRTDTKRHFDFHKSTAFPHRSRDFRNELHTLAMFDPDAPFATYGSRSRPYMHMLVTNIWEGDFLTGDVVLPYSGPWPPDSNHHTYYFMMFKQAKEFNPQIEVYASLNCSGIFYGRCSFNMAALIQHGDLELVGASWQLMKKTDYVRYVLTELGVDERELCADVEGYTPNCTFGDNDTTDTASSSFADGWFLFLCVFMNVRFYIG